MVRILVRAFIILLFFPSIIKKDQEKIKNKKVSILLQKNKQNKQNTDKLEELAKASLNQINLTIPEKNCTISALKVHAYSNKAIQAFDVQIMTILDNQAIEINIEKLFFFEQNLIYFFSAENCCIKYINAVLHAKQALMNTESKCIILKICNCKYNGFIIKTKADVIIKDSIATTNNISVFNNTIEIFAEQASINLTKNMYAKNITVNQKIDDIKITMSQIQKINDIIIANKININNNILKLTTDIAQIKNENSINFPQRIIICISKIILVADHGKKIDDKIMLYNIKIHNIANNIKSFAKNGYIDLKNKKLILENGDIL